MASDYPSDQRQSLGAQSMLFTELMHEDEGSARTSLSASAARVIRRRMDSLGVPAGLVEALLPLLPASLTGVLVYGSWARGDARGVSDLDVLVLDETGISPKPDDRISLSFYSEQQLREATGTLFGFHLARDGKVVLDGQGQLGRTLAAIEPPDPEVLLEKIRRLSAVLTVNSHELASYLPGLTQVARYLLRSALYAEALKDGNPSFSVGDLAVRRDDPSLRELLSSHANEQHPASASTFAELQERLERVVGAPPDDAAGKSLEAVVVEAWPLDRDLSNLALLALGTESEGVPYSELPKVVL